YRISLIVEDRWVTWMGYEIGEVCTFWQMTCKWCCCIKRNNHCAWLQLVDNACCNLADNGIWNSQNNDFCAFQSCIDINSIDAEFVLEACFTDFADFDVTYIETRPLEVLGETISHLAASSEQSNSCHDCISFPGFW